MSDTLTLPERIAAFEAAALKLGALKAGLVADTGNKFALFVDFGGSVDLMIFGKVARLVSRYFGNQPAQPSFEDGKLRMAIEDKL